MIDHDRLLRWAIATLESAGIPYMISGSLASSIYGRARATNDADIVIDVTSKDVAVLMDAVAGTEFYGSPAAAQEAVTNRTMFNVIDPVTGAKIDFIVRKNRPFSVAELERRRRLPFNETEAYFASPEDVILSKLEWAQLGESERQLTDASHVAIAYAGQLDVAYLRYWAGQLGIVENVEKVLSRSAG